MNDEQIQTTVLELRAELARAQQQMADMAAAQEDFLRAVSHDLRAPLRHFTSYGKLARETLGDLPSAVVQGAEVQEVLGFLSTMEQSGRRMGLMFDGLHALAQARRAPLRLQPVALADALASARTEAMAGEPGRAVDWRIAPDLPTLQADPALLHALLVQLLGNALKFTRGSATPPRIEVQGSAALPSHGEPDRGAGLVAFTVRDNGVGFDNARAGQLFGVFQRLHRESDFDGVGAGLALCRAIAQRHGASITASGQPGAGCAVHVQWPGASS